MITLEQLKTKMLDLGKIINKVIKDIHTEKDGESFDFIRVLAVVGGMAYVGMGGYAISHHQATDQFDFQNWAIGFAAILAAAGAGVGMKSKTESEPTATPKILNEGERP